MRPQIRFNERFSKALSVREDYESHKKKLNDLSRQKGPYAINKSSIKLEQLKNRKQNDFIRIRNKKINSINKANNTIFEKLLESQQINRNTCVANATISFLRQSASQKSPCFDKPIIQKKQIIDQIQNEKLFNRLTTLKPTINRRKIQSQYEASRKYKDRISKFQGNSMKKNIFVDKQMSKRNSSFSSRVLDERQKSLSIRDTKCNSTVFSREISRSYYKSQDILKNKVEDSMLTKNRLKQLHRISFRPFNNKLCTDISKFLDEKTSDEQKRFFATEIENINLRQRSKNGNGSK